MEMLVFAGAAVVKIAVVMGVVLLTVAFLTLAERKVLSWMQDRMGPMEVGPYGILQPLADGIKLFFKEDIVPSGANRLLFSLAPILSLVPAFIGDRKSTRLNSSHLVISYAVFCLKKKKIQSNTAL